MTIFILTMIILIPFTLAFTAYALTDGFVLNENYSIDQNKVSDAAMLNNSIQLCYENIA